MSLNEHTKTSTPHRDLQRKESTTTINVLPLRERLSCSLSTKWFNRSNDSNLTSLSEDSESPWQNRPSAPARFHSSERTLLRRASERMMPRRNTMGCGVVNVPSHEDDLFLSASFRLARFAKEVKASHQSSKEVVRILNRVKSNDPKITKICLRGQRNIDDLDALKLAIALRGNTNVTSIDLGGCHLTSEGAKCLFKTLRKNSTVRILRLDGNSIGNKGAKAAAEALLKGKLLLTRLDLSENGIKVDGATSLAGALCVCELERLDLGGNEICDKGAEEIASTLYLNTKLAKLGLDGNEIGSGPAKLLAEALRHNGTLLCLDLRANLIGKEGVKAFTETIAHNNTLVELVFDSDQAPPVLAEKINNCLRRNSIDAEEKGMREIAAARKGRLEKRKSQRCLEGCLL